MVNSGYILLNTCYENGEKTTLDKYKQKKYLKFQEEMDNDKSTIRQRAEDVEILVLNNS